MGSLSKWRTEAEEGYLVSPWQDAERLFSMISGEFSSGPSRREDFPVLDVIQDEQGYRVSVELPGVERKNVKVTLEDGVLTVSGEKKEDTRSGDERRTLVERSYGLFSRSLRLAGPRFQEPSGSLIR